MNFRLGINVSTIVRNARALATNTRGLRDFGRQQRVVNQQTTQMAGRFRDTNGRLREANNRFVGMGGSAKNAGFQLGSFNLKLPRVGANLKGLTSNVFNLRNALIATAAVLTGGALFQGLIGTNQALEDQTISMAALIKANTTFTTSQGTTLTGQDAFNASLETSNKLINQFRADALRGAGTSAERIAIFNAALNPAQTAGANLQGIRALTNEALTVSKLVPQLRNDANQAARDVNLILSGNAGTEVALFSFLKSRLGDAESFNALTAPERLARLRAALQEFADPAVVKAQAESFSGLVSSFADLRDVAFQTLGGPLFAKAKQGLSGLLSSLIDQEGNPTNRAKEIQASLLRIGNGIVSFIQKVRDFGQRAIGFYKEYVAPAIQENIMPFVSMFVERFSQGFQLINQYLRENQQYIKPMIKGFIYFQAAYIGVYAVVAGFIGLGLGAVIFGIVAAFTEMSKWVKIVVSDLGIFINNAKTIADSVANFFLNSFDRIFLGFVNMARDVVGAAKGVPVLGSLIGGIDSSLGAAAGLDSLASSIQLRMNERSGQPITNYITQHISTNDATVAGNTAARGVGRAVQKSVPGAGRTGNNVMLSYSGGR